MARLRTFAPLLLALPLLLAGCDQVRELVGGSKMTLQRGLQAGQ